MSLQNEMDRFGSPLEMLKAPPYLKQAGTGFPYPPVHTNWRDEQRAWNETALLFDQSYHMSDLFITGPDAVKLLSDTSVNSYANFSPSRAKQYLAVNEDGYVIGDSIAVYFPDGTINVAGHEHSLNWLQYNAQAGGYDVEFGREPASRGEAGSKRLFRFELEGPHAWKTLERAAGRKLDKIGFFKVDALDIAGIPVIALNHSMGSAPGADSTGLELFGPHEHRDAFIDAIVAAGEEFGLLRGGAITYASTIIEGGWLGMVVPAVYTSEKLRDYREWLPAKSEEARGLAFFGSYQPENVEEYYSTPWDLGYGHMIKFDHDFIGRDALEKMADQPHGNKAWFIWNTEDTERALIDGDLSRPGSPRPLTSPQVLARDVVLSGDTPVGKTIYHGYTENIGCWTSVGTAYAGVQDGDEVELLWGDDDGGARNPFVRNHTQRRIRARVSMTSPAKRA